MDKSTKGIRMKLIEALSKTSRALFKSVFLSFTITCFVFAQQWDNKFDENQKINVIEKVLELIKDNYVFPNKYNQIEHEIRKKLSNKEFEVYNNFQDFLNYLNKTLQQAGEDKHLNISFGPEIVKQIKADIEAEKNGKKQVVQAYTPELLAWMKFENYGLKKVERIDGNIGYFKFDRFTDLGLAKKAIVGAMNFINNSSAIIIDLRDNGGGESEASNFIINYFFPDNKKIGEVKFRKDKKAKEVIVKNDKDVKKFSNDVPVYILVSNKTASAAENVAYVLQQFKRGVVIGEQTSGKANPGELFVVNDFLYMMVPTGSGSITPSGTNWEGTGVVPDIRIDQPNALAKAITEICLRLEKSDPNKEHKFLYSWIFDQYNFEFNPPERPSQDYINNIVGSYEGGNKIVYENDSLYFVGNTGIKRMMIYMKNETFMIEGRNDYRVTFPANPNSIDHYKIIWYDNTEEIVNKK